MTDLGEVFKNNTSIHSFEELSFFIGLQSIGAQAFYGCTELNLITIPQNVGVVGNQAFWNCPALQTVYFNATNCDFMQSNNNYSVFSANTNGGASALTRVVFGNNVTCIPDYAFKGSQDIYQRLVIPASVEHIGKEAFSGCSGLVLMTIQGDGLQTIGERAFYNCSSLRSLELPDSVISIGNSAFYDCSSLPSVSFGTSLISIGSAAFCNCSGLTGELVFPDSVTTIGDNAFYGCSSLSSVTLGTGLTSIGSNAFKNCNGLTAVHYSGNIDQWCGITFGNKPSNPLAFGHTLYINDALVTDLSVPEGVTAIPNYAFYGGTTFTSLSISSTVTSIGNNAFDACSGFSGELLIPDAVTSIGEYAFYGCSGFTGELVIPDAMTWIGQYAFYNCNGFTGELVIPDAVTAIGQYAFFGCSGLTSLTIGEGINTIGSVAFGNCPNLSAVHFNATNCTSNNQVFNSPTPIVNLTIGHNVTRIPGYAFMNSRNLGGSLQLPDALTYIGQSAFQGCSGLTGDLSIPSGVTTFGESAFNGCTGFSGSLVFGKMVNSIGNYAFNNCNGFTTVISENPTPPTANNNSFQGMNFSIPVYVPFNTVSTYQSTAGWSNFTNYKEQCVFDAIGMETENWSDEQNWYAAALPTETDVVCVNSNCHLNVDADVLHLYVYNVNDALTIDNGATLTVSNGISTMAPSQLIIADGGQLVNTSGPVNGTVQKHINSYGTGDEGWYCVASPVMGGTEASVLTTGDYDLFAYDEPTHYWRNQKVAGNELVTLNPGQGYLYANQAGTTLSFTGKLNASNTEFSVPVTYEGTPLEGYTLLGNPYTNDLSISDVQLNGTPLTTYYKINGGGSFVAYTEPIHPCEGFLVMAPEGGTITFAPSSGQGRDNNMTGTKEEGDPAGFRLPDHGDLIDVDAYNGEIQYVSVTAVANATEYGTVLGSGNYAVGSTCTLTAIPNEIYSFVNWTCNGVPVSTEPSYCFTVLGAVSYTANFVQTIFTQTASLDAGWNWMSTYIDQSDIDGLTMLENALGSNGLRIVSHKNGYVEPLEVAGTTYWYGTLTEINNEQMYKVLTNAPCNAPIMGPMASPSTHPITINSGWNWIGYPSNQSVSLNEAMAGFQAEDDDIIKSRNNGYATYYDGSWFGTLNSLVPGSGYMYKSNSGASKTLVFQQGRGPVAVDAVTGQLSCAESLSGNYKDNMTLTAVVDLDGVELRSDDYEIAAFVGGECRGSVYLRYIEPIDRYVAFLTVLGEGSESVSFRLSDDELLALSAATLTFEADATLGTLNNPMRLSFSTLGIGENAQVNTEVFPNPVKDVLFVEGVGMKRIEVFNVMGQMAYHSDVEGEAVRIDMSGYTNGVYMVRVLTENGLATHHIVKE